MNRIVKAKTKGKNYGFRYIMECNYCHKEFSINGMRFNSGVGKFCSFSCRTAYRNTTQTGKNSNNWRGGELKTSLGYIRVYAPKHPNNRFRYVLKHRLVMEDKIGRYLTDDEIVHHVNHDKSDNRIENLTILSASQHSIHHYPTNMKGVVRDSLTGKFTSKHKLHLS